jgi:hypothetical protein
MCPSAFGAGGKKYWLQDHDTDIIGEEPPVLNQWYTLFEADDVRLLEMYVSQMNEEENMKDIEVRWTIDGNVYAAFFEANNGTIYFIFRDMNPSIGGTQGLGSDTVERRSFVDDFKCGLHFKVEVRIVSVLGTSQGLYAAAVRETLEET